MLDITRAKRGSACFELFRARAGLVEIGIEVVLRIAWLASAGGHLLLLIGYTKKGDPLFAYIKYTRAAPKIPGSLDPFLIFTIYS